MDGTADAAPARAALGAGAPPRGAVPWAPALAALAAGLVALGALFFREGAAAVGVWNASTTYNHCWLILPIAGWLAWTRRERLRGLLPEPRPALALLALPCVLAWLAAERLGIMEGRQLAVIGMVWALALAVLGPRVARAMAAPLAYLVFLVPFGAFVTPALQRVTAWIIEAGLSVAGIPHFVDDLIIEIPEGTFLVAEACAGLRFLVAAVAFGALYALMMFRSPGRRLVVMALSVVVPIVANGLRALGIVVLGHVLGSADAAAADHVIYGWGFFAAVMLLLILAGLPFREDAETASPPAEGASPPPPRSWRPAAAAPASGRRALAAAGGLAVALAAAGPAAAAALGGGGAPAAVAPRLLPPDGCVAGPEPGLLRCGAGGALRVAARLLVFPPRASWGAVAAEHGRALLGDEEDAVFAVAGEEVRAAWRVRQRRDGAPAAVAAAAWLDGRPAGGGLRARLEQARSSIAGGGGAPVLAVLTLERPAGGGGGGGLGAAAERRLLEAILAAQAAEGGLAAQAAALSARPPR